MNRGWLGARRYEHLLQLLVPLDHLVWLARGCVCSHGVVTVPRRARAGDGRHRKAQNEHSGRPDERNSLGHDFSDLLKDGYYYVG
jgi:hypothetical protein